MNSVFEIVWSPYEKSRLLFLNLYHHTTLTFGYVYSQDEKKNKVKTSFWTAIS